MLAVLVGQRTLRLPVTGFERSHQVQAPATAYVKLSWLHHCRAQWSLPGGVALDTLHPGFRRRHLDCGESEPRRDGPVHGFRAHTPSRGHRTKTGCSRWVRASSGPLLSVSPGMAGC